MVSQKIRKAQTKKEGLSVSLFERLKNLRRELAQQEGVPPYVIFHDSTLREMAQAKPLNRQGLLEITGIGERKLDKYGDAFLNVISDFMANEGREKGLEDPPMGDVKTDSKIASRNEKEERRKMAAKTTGEKILSHQITYQLYAQGYSLEDIAKERKMTLLTVQDHLVRCSTEGAKVEWDDFIPAGLEKVILEAAEKAGRTKLRPIKDLLPEDVEWFTIRAVLEKHKVNGERDS